MHADEFRLTWTPERQILYGKSRVFDNEGTTRTLPTHDLAHLLVAASGDLDWAPVGTSDEIRVAEYNAVFLENLLDKTFYNVVNKSKNPPSILGGSLRHLRWFVTEHYAPFPMAPEEAYRRFCWEIDASTVVRLSPLFFAMREAEYADEDFRNKRWEAHFSVQDVPETTEFTAKCQRIFSDVIHDITRPT